MHIGDGEFSTACQLLPNELRDASRANAVVAGIEIVDSAAGTKRVERIVVQRLTDRIVVRVDEPAIRRVHHLRHFRERQDLERKRLLRLRMRNRHPFIAAASIAQEVGWKTGHLPGL